MESRLQAPEWAPHAAVFIGFPSHPDLWAENLEPARREVAAFARAVHADGEGERVILVAGDAASAAAAQALTGHAAEVVVEPFGDIWLRDTAPIVVGQGAQREAVDFDFNGWGGKYVLANDDSVGTRLASRMNFPVRRAAWVFEGGAIDSDGTGLVVTTEQCLLNPNRNPTLDKAAIEQHLRRDLGFARVLWLGDGLQNDHTDGHVDNLARFVAANTLLLPVGTSDDPNAHVFADANARAKALGVNVVEVPSAGRIERHGAVVPATYMNFYIGNRVVVVPTYAGAQNLEPALEVLRGLFPSRHVVALSADATLSGGGSFHCISQQIPE